MKYSLFNGTNCFCYGNRFVWENRTLVVHDIIKWVKIPIWKLLLTQTFHMKYNQMSKYHKYDA